MATPNAVNNNLNQGRKTNNQLSISKTVLAATKKAWDEEIYDTGDPCKNDTGGDSIAVLIEKVFIALKGVQLYGDFVLNTVSNTVANIQSTITKITSAIAGILKTLVQRLRNWVLNKLKALIEQALTYVATNLAKELKKAIVNTIIDQIFCAFEEIIGGLVGLVGDFLYSLIGQIINTPICAAEAWLNALTSKLINDIDKALEPIFDSINDILSGVGTIAGSVYEAIDFVLGFQGFLCGAPNCPEVTRFKLGSWAGPTQSFRNDFSKLNFDNSFVDSGTKTANGWLEDFFGPDSGTLNQSPGECYTGAFECGIPQVEIFGGGGSGAVGQAVVNTIGEVVGVNLLNGGSGYQSAPFVSIVDPAGCGSNAAAYAIMETDDDGYPTGSVSDIVINDPGYGYDDTYNGGAPVITSFTGAPNPLVVGNSVSLSWNVSNADTVSLGIAGYNDLPLTGSISIPVTDVTFEPNSSTATVTYTLTATKDNTSSSPQTTTRTFILTVLQDTTSGTSGTTNTNPPVIDSFTASETNVNPGDIVTLFWQTTNATNVSLNLSSYTDVSVDGSASIVIPSETEFPADGSSITNTYTLTATNTNAPEGSQTATQTVSVEIGPPSISTTPGGSSTGGGTGTSPTDGGTGTGGTGTGTGAGTGGNTSGTGNNDAVAVLDDIDIIGTGIGYNNGDTVSIEDDTGTGATAQIQTNQLGQIVGINVLDGGYGFTRIPAIRINTREGAGAKFRARLRFIPINQFLLDQQLQVIDPNKLVKVVDCVTR